jgi:RNase P subunit RPR2
MWLRKLFMCWWGGCGGRISDNNHGVIWECHRCGAFARYPWEDIEVRRQRLSSSD